MTVEHRLRIGDRNVLLVEGPAGWGECSPLPGYPCEYDAARAAAEEAATRGWPAPVRSVVSVNGFVAAAASLADEHASAVLCEYPSVKVKVGRLSPDDEVNRIARVRDLIGPTVGLRVDANGAWDLETAVATLTRLARYDLEFAEQPVASLSDLRAVRHRVTVPIAADECAENDIYGFGGYIEHHLVSLPRGRVFDGAVHHIVKTERAAVAVNAQPEAGRISVFGFEPTGVTDALAAIFVRGDHLSQRSEIAFAGTVQFYQRARPAFVFDVSVNRYRITIAAVSRCAPPSNRQSAYNRLDRNRQSRSVVGDDLPTPVAANQNICRTLVPDG